MKYSFIKLFYCVWLTKNHARIFKTYYRQDFTLKRKHKIELRIFDLLFGICPDFRKYTKKYKPVFHRAYYQRRANFGVVILEKRTRNINTLIYS